MASDMNDATKARDPFDVASDMNDATKARETQQRASSALCDSKATEKVFMLEQSSDASAIARYCQHEKDSTGNTGGYAM